MQLSTGGKWGKSIFWDKTLSCPVLLVSHSERHAVKTWGEYQDLIETLYKTVREHKGHVYLIFDVGDARLPPGNAIRYLREGFETTPDNVRAAYMITRNPVVRRFVEIVMRLTISHPAIRKYQFVHSRDEAYRRIRVQEGEMR